MPNTFKSLTQVPCALSLSTIQPNKTALTLAEKQQLHTQIKHLEAKDEKPTLWQVAANIARAAAPVAGAAAGAYFGPALGYWAAGYLGPVAWNLFVGATPQMTSCTGLVTNALVYQPFLSHARNAIGYKYGPYVCSTLGSALPTVVKAAVATTTAAYDAGRYMVNKLVDNNEPAPSVVARAEL